MPTRRVPIQSLRVMMRDKVRAGARQGVAVSEVAETADTDDKKTLKRLYREEKAHYERVRNLATSHRFASFDTTDCSVANGGTGYVRVGVEIMVTTADGQQKRFGVEVELNAAKGRVYQFVQAAVEQAIAHATKAKYIANPVREYTSQYGAAANASMTGRLKINYIEC